MRLYSDGIWVNVHSTIPADHAFLYEALKYHPPGYEHQFKFKHGGWDGFDHLYDTKACRFRAGLLSRVEALLVKNSVDYTIEHAKYADTDDLIKVTMKPVPFNPFDYQLLAAAAAMHHERGLIVLPTGAGKTFVIAKLIEMMARKALVIVTDIVLLDQMFMAMNEFLDMPIGVIGDSEFELEDVTVTTVQSLRAILTSKAAKNAERKSDLLKYIAQVGMVLSDEAHLADSESFEITLSAFTNTRRFYGLSATPYGWSEKAEKRNNILLEQHFGSKIYDGRKLDFVELGIKVPLVVEYHKLPYVNLKYERHFKKGPRGVKYADLGKNYRDCLETELLNNNDYSALVAELAWAEVAAGRSIFVHAAHSLEFGSKLNELIPGSVFVNGSTKKKERREIYAAMRTKDRLVMVSDVGGTGLDIKSLDTILLASDLKDIRQISGRVLRSDGRKKFGKVIDLAKDCMFLKKHAVVRKAQYNNQHTDEPGEDDERED